LKHFSNIAQWEREGDTIVPTVFQQRDTDCSFLEYYQIISAIPNRLLTKAKDTATKEFYFNFMYRIIVTNRELLKFGINEMMNAYTADKTTSLTTHSLHALLREDICKRRFPMVQRNKRQITPATEEKLFGVISNSYDRKTNEEI